MKKSSIILIVIMSLVLFIACDNNTPADYNNLTEEQKTQYNLIGSDVTKAISLITYNSTGEVTSTPNGVSVTRKGTQNGDKGVISLKYTFNSYEGSSGTITGSVVYNYNYSSLSDLYYSSISGAVSLTSTKDGVSHILSSMITAQTDKNTGAVTSSVETGSFDGSKYRETNTY